MTRKTDWPTLALIIGCYGTWLALIFMAPLGVCLVLLPFVIALQYGVETKTLARAILITSILTLFTLAWMTA